MPTTGRTSCRPTSANGCSPTAKELGYPGPDPVARSLRTRKAGAVGLVITEPLDYSFSDPAALDFVAGLAESCEEAGQGLLLVAVGPGPQRRRRDGGGAGRRRRRVRRVLGRPTTTPTCAVVSQRGLPVVVVDQPTDVPGASRVGIDDRAAMRALAEHVVGLGHRQHRAADDATGAGLAARWRRRPRSPTRERLQSRRTFTSSGNASAACSTR